MVNAEGKRSTDEAAPYHDVVNATPPKRSRRKIVTWLITDQEYRNRYLFKDTLPGFDLLVLGMKTSRFQKEHQMNLPRN